MARDPNQIFIFSDDELNLIKHTFADNDTLLYTVRKVLLQFPLTDTEKGLIKLSITPEIHRILKKRILPDIGDEFPLGQLADIRTTLTEQLKVKSVEDIAPLIDAKKIEIDYLNQQFEMLRNIDNVPSPITEISLAKMASFEDKDEYDTYVDLHAYLFILGYIDPMLLFIKSIAGEKKETVAEQKARMQRDSSK